MQQWPLTIPCSRIHPKGCPLMICYAHPDPDAPPSHTAIIYCHVNVLHRVSGLTFLSTRPVTWTRPARQPCSATNMQCVLLGPLGTDWPVTRCLRHSFMQSQVQMRNLCEFSQQPPIYAESKLALVVFDVQMVQDIVAIQIYGILPIALLIIIIISFLNVESSFDNSVLQEHCKIGSRSKFWCFSLLVSSDSSMHQGLCI